MYKICQVSTKRIGSQLKGRAPLVRNNKGHLFYERENIWKILEKQKVNSELP